MNPKPQWSNLQRKKCPKCSSDLKVHESIKFPNDTMHKCNNCDFRIRNSRLEQLVMGMRINTYKPKHHEINTIQIA